MSKRQELEVKGLAKAISHYTDAVRFGDLLFISGFIGVDENLRIVGGDDVAEQTRQIFKNMKVVLDEAGATFADILKVTVYLTDIADRTIINPVRKEFFGKSKPASTLIEISKLAVPGAKIEIEAVVGFSSKV